METAFQIRQNATEQRQVFEDLLKWESEVKPKPIKRTAVPPPRIPQERIKSNDYRKWDTFDVEKALEDVDYETFTEEELKVDETVPKDPDEALVEKEKGNLYFKKSKFLKAIECYTKSFELDHTVAVPLVNRALCFIKLKKYNEAIQDCTKALELDKKNVKASWRRGLAYKELGNLEEARKNFEYALVLEPLNLTIKKDFEEVVGKLKGVTKPTRRRIVIQDVNRPTVAKAAEAMDGQSVGNGKATAGAIDRPSIIDAKAAEATSEATAKGKNVTDEPKVIVEAAPKERNDNEIPGVVESDSQSEEPVAIVEKKIQKLSVESKSSPVISDSDLVTPTLVAAEQQRTSKDLVKGSKSVNESKDLVKESKSVNEPKDSLKEKSVNESKDSVKEKSVNESEKSIPTTQRSVRKPTTLYEFEKQWKSYPLGSIELLQFIKQFTGQELAQIFKDSFDTNYLTKILELLDLHYCKQGLEDEAKGMVVQLSVIPRFKMLSKFVRKDLKYLLSL